MRRGSLIDRNRAIVAVAKVAAIYIATISIVIGISFYFPSSHATHVGRLLAEAR